MRPGWATFTARERALRLRDGPLEPAGGRHAGPVNPPGSLACGIRASYSRLMRVLLKLTLECTPDAAWRALRSPAVLREVVAPWLDFSSLEDGGLPTTWPEGRHRVRALAFRRFPAGEELVDVSYPGGLPDGRAHAPRRRRRAHRPARRLRSLGPPHGGLGAARRAHALPRPADRARRGARPRGVVPDLGVLAVARHAAAAARPGVVVRPARHRGRRRDRRRSPAPAPPRGPPHERLDRLTAARGLAPPRVRALRGRPPAQRARPRIRARAVEVGARRALRGASAVAAAARRPGPLHGAHGAAVRPRLAVRARGPTRRGAAAHHRRQRDRRPDPVLARRHGAHPVPRHARRVAAHRRTAAGCSCP